MIANYSKKFIKQLKKSPNKIRKQAGLRITEIFIKTPFHPTLNNHALTGEYGGCRSINITGDWRAIYTHINKDTVLFVDLGTHNQLYGK